MVDHVAFTCNGRAVDVDTEPGESLLNVLRERLGLVGAKDGCAPQGQCGCCTVLVDGEPRVACVTPVMRVAGRAVTTIEGLDADAREQAAAAFVATGGSQCGFCTPGIVMRFAGERGARNVDRSLAAHLCRCTGWITVHDAVGGYAHARSSASSMPRLAAPSSKAGSRSRSGWRSRSAARRLPTTPRPATRSWLYRFRPVRPPSSSKSRGCNGSWPNRCSTRAPRLPRCKVGARPSTRARRCSVRCRPARRVACSSRRQWVEPAYLEPDASWCEPGGMPASPLANGGAFGGKAHSRAPAAAARARRPLRRAVRVVYSREDVVRLGPEASADRRGRGRARQHGRDRGRGRSRWRRAARRGRWPMISTFGRAGRRSTSRGPPVGSDLRATGLAEQAVLVEGALGRAPRRRHAEWRPRERARRCASSAAGSRASTYPSRPAIRSTRSCCVRTRSAPRTWRRLGLERSPRGRPGNGRGARPHDPVVRHPARGRHARDRRDDRRRSRAATGRGVRRRVRRGRGRDVERVPRRRGRIRSRRDAIDVSDSDARSCPPRARRPRRVRIRPRCAPATGSCSRARSVSTPRPAAWSTAVSRRRRARCSPTSRRCSATAARSLTDVAKTTVFVTDIGRVRHRERGVRRSLRRSQARPLDRRGRGAPRRRRGRDRGLGLSAAAIAGVHVCLRAATPRSGLWFGRVSTECASGVAPCAARRLPRCTGRRSRPLDDTAAGRHGAVLSDADGRCRAHPARDVRRRADRLFVVGGIWSALIGWLLVDDADAPRRAAPSDARRPDVAPDAGPARSGRSGSRPIERSGSGSRALRRAWRAIAARARRPCARRRSTRSPTPVRAAARG